ncbi:hypothetical protein [Anaerococcus prevotii]|uniref:hypothetical protein n=1 Tax=Anaerococcus prevotii TaxID=33034 RepID=UPI00019DD3F2|nr:hypothetical protein [Anaerococcus prevotii]
MRFLLDIIFAIIVQVADDCLYKWLDKASPSGYWKTLHGVIKRSLIKKMITSTKKDELGKVTP